ncbi:MAG: hypothetical protein OEM15_17980 [Myxococcales bacterium]|nr:hypothetical protein [Myxococcales bacterium]MDH3485005.1 hypothetical protein [Myxococcales bacterium]
MILNDVRHGLLFLALVTMQAGCGGGDSQRSPDNVINVGFDGGTIGCIQPRFPPEQPDLSVLNPPIFLLTTTTAQQSTAGQAQVEPGDPIDAEVTVNGATRRVMVELANAWSEADYIYTDEVETSGNESVSLLLFSDANVRGRYYMRLTLCGFDCDERAVVFDIRPCSDDPDVNEPCGINAPYERTLLENGEIVRVDDTCVDLRAQPGVGSGTVVIQ